MREMRSKTAARGFSEIRTLTARIARRAGDLSSGYHISVRSIVPEGAIFLDIQRLPDIATNTKSAFVAAALLKPAIT